MAFGNDRQVQNLNNEFWSRWHKEFLLSLQERQKWPHRNLDFGDVVIIKDVNTPCNTWKLACVSAVYPSDDGQVHADSLLDSKGKRTGPMRYERAPCSFWNKQ